MEIKEKKQVTEFKEVTIGRKCDVCGKIHEGKYTPDEWHTFNHHHNEWGSYSYDSYEYHEVCSPECYWIKFKECVEDLKGYSNAKVDEFEIQFARMLLENNR
jgi:hypothetical protein